MANGNRKDLPDNRENVVWSAGSRLYHNPSCPSAARISSANLQSGPAPASKKPHSCISAVDTKSAPRGQVASKSSTDIEQVNGQGTTYTVTRSVHKHDSLQKSHATNTNNHSALNPFCRCDPCQCEHPCVCGLKKVRTTVDTHWDENDQALHHTVKDTYKPDLHAHLNRLSQGTSAPSAQTHPASSSLSNHQQAAVSMETKPVDYALAQLSVKGSSTQRVLTRHEQDPGHGHHQEEMVTVRRGKHAGHDIEIRTSYEAYVDGKKLDLHIGVSSDGSVHCHAIPNYSTASGLDMIKVIVDAFPDEFPPTD